MLKKSFFVVNVIFVMHAAASNIVYIIPPGGYEDEKLFDMSNQVLNRDNCVKHFYDLRTALRMGGMDLKTTKDARELIKNAHAPKKAAATVALKRHRTRKKQAIKNNQDKSVILICGIPTDKKIIQHLKNYDPKKIIAMLWEPPTVEPKSYSKANTHLLGTIFTMADNQVDGKKYLKLYYPQPCLFMIDDIVPFAQKKLATLIAGNKKARHNLNGELYSARRQAIEFFEKYYPDQFTFYGRGWPHGTYKTYGGSVAQ